VGILQPLSGAEVRYMWAKASKAQNEQMSSDLLKKDAVVSAVLTHEIEGAMPLSSQATASPSMMHERERRRASTSTISGKRPVRALPALRAVLAGNDAEAEPRVRVQCRSVPARQTDRKR
jgi:hypothetical protein